MSTGNEGQNVALSRLLAKIRRDLRSVIAVSQSCRELSAAVKLLRVADKAILEARQVMNLGAEPDRTPPESVSADSKAKALSPEQISLLDRAIRKWEALASDWSKLNLNVPPEESIYGRPTGPAPGRTKNSFWAHVRRCLGDDDLLVDSEEYQVDWRLKEGGMEDVYNRLDNMHCHFAWESGYVDRLDDLLTAFSDENDENARDLGSQLIADAVNTLRNARGGKLDNRDWSLTDREDDEPLESWSENV